MKVQKIKWQDTNQQHWIVVGDDYLPIEPISQYLLYLHCIKKSPNTIRTYAHHLKIYWEYLATKGINWNEVHVEIIANFVGTLNGLIHGNIVHLVLEQPKRSERTVNQIIVAVANFYQYHHQAENIEEVNFHHWKKSFYTNQSFKPLLHHLSKSKSHRHSLFKLKEKKSLCKVVEPEIVKAMVAACKHLRDKLLICLLYGVLTRSPENVPTLCDPAW